jgi:HlyD family secretion protein
MRKSISYLLTLLLMLSFLAGCQGMPSNMPFNMPGISGEATPTAPIEQEVELVDSAVSVEGRLVPKESVWLSFPSAGIIEEVNVEEGDAVKKGDILARLTGDEQLASVIAAAEYELFAAQQARKLLDDNLNLERNLVLQDLNDARQEVRDTERRARFLTGIADQIDIDIARSQVVFAKNNLEKVQADWDKVKNLSEDNLRRANQQVKLSEAQKAYDDAVRKFNNLTGTANDFDQQQADTKYQIALGRLGIAQEKFDLLQNGPDPDEVANAEARIKAVEASLAAAKADLDRLNIYATIDGRVVKSDLVEGLAVTPGQFLVQLADFSEWDVVTENLTEIEVVDIIPGMNVSVIPDALPDLILQGVVLKISDTFEEKRGEITYTVRIKLNEIDPRLRWGMTVITDFEQ